jgi:sarcosine oxidase subunit beta
MSSSERPPDAIIVGGGVIGAAILFELASRGVRALLLERGAFGGGGTGRSAAIVRMHYSNRAVVRMALRSRDVLANFSEFTGSAPVYRRAGWTFLIPEELIDVALRNAVMNREEGVDVEEVDPAELASRFPGMNVDGVALALFEPGSGYADPVGTTTGYIAAARRMGGAARSGEPVLGITVQNGRVVGVRTAAGVIYSNSVIVAAGPWSAALVRGIGLELPLKVSREHELVVRVPGASMPESALSSAVECIYARALIEDDSTVLVGRGFPKEYELVEPDSDWNAPSATFRDDVLTRLARRLPDIAAGHVVEARVGLYDITPDWHPYLGPVDGLEGLVLATGGSGHCYKLAPAISEMIAEHLIGGSTDYADIGSFNLRRLEAPAARFGAAIGGNRA